MRHQTLPFRNKVSISLTLFMKKINAQFSIIQNNYLYGKTNFFGLRCLRIQGQLGHFALFPYFWEHQHNGQLDVRSRSQIIYRVWGKYDEVFFLSFSKESWFRSCLISILVPTLVVHSRSDSRPQWSISEKGTGMNNCIPNFWEWEREWEIVFPTFGNGNENSIPNFWEREREWKFHSWISGTGMRHCYSRESPGTGMAS